MPGNLRLQKTIAVSSLLHPYPQYGNLNELGWPGATDNYYGLQLKAERRMASGLTWQVGYNYSRELMSTYFNAIDTYNNNYSMIDRGWPRHNVRVAATWDLPFGTGRRLLGSADRVVNAIVGGWSTSYIFMWNSGQLLSFGQADVTCDPRMDVPQGRYFNNACFNQAPAYTLRTNPMNYPGLRGPMFWNLDATLAKTIPVTERVSVQLRGEFYNMPNVLMWGNPSAAVGSGIMGRSTAMANGNYGRQFQYSARIQF